MNRILSLAVVASFAAVPALAADPTVAVEFAKGESGRTITSSIKGELGVNYTLKVGSGQVMLVLFAVKSGSCFFNVFAPGIANEAVFIGSSSGNEYGASPTEAGTYRFNVYQMRANARRNETCKYDISFEVTGTPVKTAPISSPSLPTEVAMGACLDRFGVDATIMQISPLKPGYWELVIQASSGRRKVACTVDSEGNIEDWVEMK